jgi:ubiquinone/menaquinone biosynthesis C-methylase UbiE
MINTRRQEQGHRWFAFCYSRFIATAEQKQWGEPRRRIMGGLEGRVVEVGVGSGTNLSYYPPGVQVVAIEPDPHMLKRARQRLQELGVANIELRKAAVEQLPFEDASFEHALCTWVLCTVDDLDQTLAEVRRVLKPDGTFHFMEHVGNDQSAFWGGVQNMIAPVWRWAGAGCRLNQRTQRAIEAVGFRFEWIEQVPGKMQPVIYGVARSG